LFAYAADALIAQQFCEGPLPRTGSRRPRAAPVCVVRGHEPDTWLTVAVSDTSSWRGLCEVIGAESWLENPDFATAQGRRQRADEIEAAIAAWSGSRTPEAAAAGLQARGVAAAPVLRTDQLGYDPQLASTGFWAEMERAHVGRYITPSAPFAYDGQRPALRLPAPTLGQHTVEVLGHLS
jgi:crotonobetainyl-CoA:carnitine CoA-transferase CaiB-like acyl-CoA transferase